MDADNARNQGSQCSEPVTAVFSWQVRPGREADFEEWTHGITRAVSRFRAVRASPG